jgi:DNA-binding transcriptional MerR regulator
MDYDRCGGDEVAYKVKEVAKLAGVSIRTLHYYDKIGLLKPQSVNSAGYRLYTDKDLEKLQQILFFKELEFGLEEIKSILQSPGFDRKQVFIAQRELLKEKKKRLERVITSLEQTIESIEGGLKMDKKEMFEGFDLSQLERHKQKYAEETRQLYGNSEAYKESVQKTAKYKKEDWARVTIGLNEIFKKIGDKMPMGAADPEVQKIVGELRQYITENFYNCTPEIFRGLGDLYVSDERFTANLDRNKAGLANFLKEAIIIYCDNLDK